MKIEEIFKSHGLSLARMVSFSKSEYRRANPANIVVFNANIFTESKGKVWWGDLDVTVSKEALQAVANEIGETIYVLREHDGRFENENLPFEKVKELSIFNTK